MSKVLENIIGSGKIVTGRLFAGVWLAWFGKQGG
jgi:hypothetical protein